MICLIGSALFGILDASVYELDSGWAFWLANLVSLWLLMPFVFGTGFRKPLVSALLGLATTQVALLAFYLWLANFQISGMPFQWLFMSNYVAAGLVTGPLFGWMGGLWATRRWSAAGLILAAAFLIEPFAWRIYLGRWQPVFLLSVAEVVAGVIMVRFFTMKSRHADTHALAA